MVALEVGGFFYHSNGHHCAHIGCRGYMGKYIRYVEGRRRIIIAFSRHYLSCCHYDGNLWGGVPAAGAQDGETAMLSLTHLTIDKDGGGGARESEGTPSLCPLFIFTDLSAATSYSTMLFQFLPNHALGPERAPLPNCFVIGLAP